VSLQAGQGVKINRTEVESGFARIIATGTASELSADLTADSQTEPATRPGC